LAEAGGQLYWHLRADPFGDQNSVAQFSYAQAIPGFAAVTAPKPLEANHDYTLAVIGNAYGTIRFRVDSAGKLHLIR
jgi:hypothetical protein